MEFTPEERAAILDALDYTAGDRRERAESVDDFDTADMLIELAQFGERLIKKIEDARPK